MDAGALVAGRDLAQTRQAQLLDDRLQLSPLAKLVSSLAIGAFLVFALSGAQPEGAMPFGYTLVAIVWFAGVCHALNLLDNMDGLAAGIGDMEDELFTLNDSGKAVWKHLDGKSTLGGVAAARRRNGCATPSCAARSRWRGSFSAPPPPRWPGARRRGCGCWRRRSTSPGTHASPFR